MEGFENFEKVNKETDENKGKRFTISDETKKKTGIVLAVMVILAIGICSGVFLERKMLHTDITRAGDFEYEVISKEDRTCRLTKYNGPENVRVVIPEWVDGYRVVELGDHLFYRNSGLYGEVEIPDSVKVIGNFTFYECWGLTGVLYLPEQLVSIGDYAFYRCQGLRGINRFPLKLESIGESAFAGCSGVTGELQFPDSITYIGGYAFEACSGLSGGIALPDGITTIEPGTFRCCSGLYGELILPQNLTTIERQAFETCNFMGELVIPDSVHYIGRGAFYNSFCKGTLTLPKGDLMIEDQAFGQNGFEGSLVLPEGFVTIKEGAFKNCDFTGELVLPQKCYLTELMSDTFDMKDFDNLTNNSEINDEGEFFNAELKYIEYDEASKCVRGEIEFAVYKDVYGRGEYQEIYQDKEPVLAFWAIDMDEDCFIKVPMAAMDDNTFYFEMEVSEFKFGKRYAMEMLTEDRDVKFGEWFDVSAAKYNVEKGAIVNTKDVYVHHAGAVLYVSLD